MSKTLYIERGESGITIRRKDGSYFCCCGEIPEPTCCMYPADKLGIDYTTADLPAAVDINWPGNYTGAASKSGSGYAAGSILIEIASNKWRLRNTATSPETTRTIGRCLIREDDLVADQFDDEFESDWSGGAFDSGSANFTRTALCVWFADNYPVLGTEINLDSGGIEYNNTTCKWEMRFTSAVLSPTLFIWVKTGDQNTPAGSYEYEGASS
jgi:hypothetical protein